MVSRAPLFFQLHDYSSNMEERITIYNLQGRSSLWWEHLVKLKYIDEENITRKNFKNYFQQEYLSEKYYDNKMEELFELKLGNLTMDA